MASKLPIDRSISLPTFVSPLTFWDYVRIYRQQVAIAIAEPAEGLAIFVLVAFGAAAMKIRSGNLRDPYLHLVYLVGILAIGRILVMPESFYRALLPCYLMATVALIHACVFSKNFRIPPAAQVRCQITYNLSLQRDLSGKLDPFAAAAPKARSRERRRRGAAERRLARSGSTSCTRARRPDERRTPKR